MPRATREAAYVVGPYQEPSLVQTLRNHAHALCPDPADADRLVSATVREAAALHARAPATSSEDTRLALLSFLYARWRLMQDSSAPAAQ